MAENEGRTPEDFDGSSNPEGRGEEDYFDPFQDDIFEDDSEADSSGPGNESAADDTFSDEPVDEPYDLDSPSQAPDSQEPNRYSKRFLLLVLGGVSFLAILLMLWINTGGDDSGTETAQQEEVAPRVDDTPGSQDDLDLSEDPFAADDPTLDDQDLQNQAEAELERRRQEREARVAERQRERRALAERLERGDRPIRGERQEDGSMRTVTPEERALTEEEQRQMEARAQERASQLQQAIQSSARSSGDNPFPDRQGEAQAFREDRGGDARPSRAELIRMQQEQEAQGSADPDEQFLDRISQQSEDGVRLSSVEGPLGPWTLPTGTIIPIRLETSTETGLPGIITARVARDVYDRTSTYILIPRGSRVVSDYGQPSQVGQRRLLVAATRLILPDGRFVQFSRAQATDPLGRAGLRDEVDLNLASRFGGAGALAVLGAGITAASGVNQGGVTFPGGSGFGEQRSFDEQLRLSFVGQLNQIINELLQRQINRPVTLRLRSGLRGQLILGQDVDMQRPHYEEEGDIERARREFLPYERARQAQRTRRIQTGRSDPLSDQLRRTASGQDADR